jgi:hypothetical protein
MLDRPALNLVVLDDEPVAAPPPPPADKFDARSINRAAVKHFSVIFHMLVDLRGFPGGDIRRLNPALMPIDPNHARPADQRRLTEFSGLTPWENEDGSGPGAWYSRATGASGRDVISLIQWLATDCERRVAADYLKSLTDRCVELPK